MRARRVERRQHAATRAPRRPSTTPPTRRWRSRRSGRRPGRRPVSAGRASCGRRNGCSRSTARRPAASRIRHTGTAAHDLRAVPGGPGDLHRAGHRRGRHAAGRGRHRIGRARATGRPRATWRVRRPTMPVGSSRRPGRGRAIDCSAWRASGVRIDRGGVDGGPPVIHTVWVTWAPVAVSSQVTEYQAPGSGAAGREPALVVERQVRCTCTPTATVVPEPPDGAPPGRAHPGRRPHRNPSRRRRTPCRRRCRPRPIRCRHRPGPRPRPEHDHADEGQPPSPRRRPHGPRPQRTIRMAVPPRRSGRVTRPVDRRPADRCWSLHMEEGP